jgi:energy-coupling factor transport system ATP-binding protein
MPNFSVKNVTYSYPNFTVPAVKNISFSIAQGEYVAVLGANGSGKSTLARLMTGFLEPDVGTITIQGRSASQKNTVPSGIVFQSPRDQIVAETLERDTGFGPENIGCSLTETKIRVRECLSLIDLLDRSTDKTASLSLGQKQKLALSGILALSPDLLVLDEAVSMVDPDMRLAILDYLDTWHTSHRTIVHITHDIDETLRATHIIAIDNGSLIFDGTRDEFCNNHSISQRLFGSAPPSLRPSQADTFDEPGLVFQNVNFVYAKVDKNIKATEKTKLMDKFYGGVQNISLAFERGKVTALMGNSGSGKTTILELAAGLLKPTLGCVMAASKPVLALQETESALFEEFVADDVAFGPRNQGMKGIKLKECVKNAMDMAAIPFLEYGNRRSYALSGGEKRKIALAGIIAMQSQVYLFDEPTAGLDPLSRHQIMHMLAKLAEQGKTVVFSTHRKEEGEFAHRCIQLSNGKVFADTNGAFTSDLDCNNGLLEPVHCGDLSMLDGLRNTTIGLYVKRKSLIHSRKPSTKYLLFLAIFITGIALQNFYLLCGISIISVGYVMLARYSLKKLIITFLKFLPWILLFASFQFLLFPMKQGESIYWAYSFITITPSKVSLVIKTVLHIVAALSAITAFLYSTEETELLDGLKTLCHPLDKIKIKSKYIAMTASLVFRFVPLLADEAAQIIKVQIIRGSFKPTKGLIHRVKSMLPLFVPLILQTFKRAEALGDTLDARYF